jgi:hypothetical protein
MKIGRLVGSSSGNCACLTSCGIVSGLAFYGCVVSAFGKSFYVVLFIAAMCGSVQLRFPQGDALSLTSIIFE